MIHKVLKYGVSYRREWLYMIPHKVRDVVKIHNMSEDPHIIIEGKRLSLPVDTYAANVKMPNVDTFVKFYDTKFNHFYYSTPVSRIISESFFLEIEQDLYFIINNDPIIKAPQSSIFAQTEASSVLQPIVASAIKDLQGSPFVLRNTVINSLLKKVMEESFDLKIEKVMLTELLKIVEQKIAGMEENIKKAEQKLALKAKRRVKWFTNFLIAEVALLHYFIYFNLSWDIMQPVTVIIGNIDIMMAYWFFILKGKNFSPEGWQQEIFNKKKFRHLLKEGIDVPKYEEYLSIREYLKSRLGLLTRSPSIFLETVEKPLKLLDLE